MTSNNNTMTFNNHTITINNTGNGTMAVNGYHFYNQSRDDSHTITINGKQVTITINFVSPTSAGISVNGAAYTLTVGQMITVDDPIYITLKALSYLPIKQGVDLDVFTLSPEQPVQTTTTTAPTTLSTTLFTTTIAQTVPTSSTTIIASETPTQSPMLADAIGVLVVLVVIALVIYVYSQGRRRKSAIVASKK